MTAPSKPYAPVGLSPSAALDAKPIPPAETGFDGTTLAAVAAPAPPQQPDQFQGLGPVLEDSDADVFKNTDDLVMRQELLAKNHLACDNHFGLVVGGYPWSTLTHDTTKDVYTQTLPYGVSAVSIQAVPNKNLDLVNKTSEQLLVDFPHAEAEPIDDSEEAEAAADLANRFLKEDAGEQGTNDAVLYDDRVKLALHTASSYIEYWTDPTGGGYVPLQIDAHPQAVSPDKPLVGPDGMPTTDTVLRYVTAPQGGQFTDDPTQAAPQWRPKIRATKWGREHLRVYPEHLPVDQAEKVIILGHCTIGEAKRRWDTVAQMAPPDLTALCDWTPPRYSALLPAFQRARWKLTDGKEKNKGGSSDERIMFYYHIYQRATPDYPKGADVVVTGASGGLVIERKLLAKEVTVTKERAPVKEMRCREIPVVQITPRGDPSGQDPSGKAYVETFAGATANNAELAMGFAENVDKNNHTPYVTLSTSEISGDDVEDARASGAFLQVSKIDDLPHQLEPPKLPQGFFEMYNLSDEAINSIASRERAAQGADTSKERSGKAIQLAVSQNNIGNTSMLTAVNNAYARGCRIKLELVMADFDTAQTISYVGEDGAFKQDEFSGVDFALVGKVSIKAGTGTGLPSDQKVNMLGQLAAEGFIDKQEATEAARPSFSRMLGLNANPHEQYVERCVDSWLQGPPKPDPEDIDPATGEPKIDPTTGQPVPDWAAKYRAWMTAQQQYEQAKAVYTQQTQLFQQGLELKAQVAAGAPSPLLGPEGQNAQAADVHARAGLMLQAQPYPDVMPQPPQAPQVPKPWVPFEPRPNDTEPAIAAIWMRKTSLVISSVEYTRFGPEWADVLNRQYTTTRQAVAMAGGQQPQQQPAGKAPAKPTQPTQPTHATPKVGAAA